MKRFLSPNPLSPNQKILLDEKQSHHFHHVLRLSEGEEIELFDGLGNTAIAKVCTSSKSATQVIVGEVQSSIQKNNVNICFALPKSSALEFIFKRCAEIGALGFQPLITDHSVSYKGWNSDRWSRILQEVGKQCQDPWLASCQKPTALDQWLARRDPSRQLVFCDEARRASGDEIKAQIGCDLLVGSEGGWSDKERYLIEKQSPIYLGLGRNRLRCETACLVALTLIKQKIGEIS